jgi:WhiB family transcriptional regulator, redox-sensing transcriptional regulator
MVSPDREEWVKQAKCAGTKDILFAEGAAQRRVKIICSDCPVKRHCLAEALDDQVEWGVWGGKTERERRSLLRAHPDVTSWRSLLLEESDLVR